jgi:hypothetical protein
VTNFSGSTLIISASTSTFITSTSLPRKTLAIAPFSSGVRRSTRAVLTPDPKTGKQPRFNKSAEDREAKKNSIVQQPRGFTPYAEKVNGRIAQLAFVTGLVTEIFSRDHLSMGQQILYMFSPVTKLFGF